MPIDDNGSRAQFTATAGQTVFTYPFEIFADADLKVYLTPSGQTADDAADILTLTTDYTVTGAGNQNGGTVTLINPASAGDTVTIVRDVAIKRTTDYQDLGDLLADTLDGDADQVIAILQQIVTKLGRSVQLADSDPATGLVLPVSRANQFLGFDANGNIIAAAGTSANLGPVSAFIDTLLDDADASTALSTLGVSAYIKTLLDDADAATARGTLDLSGAYGIGSQFVVTPNTGALTVTVTGGYVQPKGSTQVQSVTGNTLGAVAPVTAGNSKIDMVCVDVSNIASPSLVIVQGTEATTPVRPSLLPTQIPIAEFTLNYGDTEISSVVDVRNFIETNDFRGALVYRTTDVSDITGAGVTVGWDAEEYDITTYGPTVQNFHSTTVNNSRLTVPNGVKYCRLSAQIALGVSPASGNIIANFNKNGSTSYKGAIESWHLIGSGETYKFVLTSPVLKVTPGDYFELFVNSTAAGTHAMLAAGSWFALEVIE